MKIDKGIERPDSRVQPKYGFCRDMAVGDSVDVSEVENPRFFYLGMQTWGSRNGMRFSKRGDRVWRVE